MEQYPPVPDNTSINPKPNRWQALAFLEIGLVEAGFVAVVLLILLGTLNYFNILSVSDVFPNQLGFLPRQTQPKTSQNTSLYKPTVAPAPTIPDNIIANAKFLMEDVLAPSFLPANSFFIMQGIENSNGSNIYSAGASWIGKDKERLSATVKYNQSQLITARQIAIYMPQAIVNLDASGSALLASKYIKIEPQSVFKCKSYLPSSKLIFCESFWEDTNGVKRGIDVSSPVFGSNETQIFYCEFHKENPNYSWTSCSKL